MSIVKGSRVKIGWKQAFIINVEQLGDNLFFVEYTRDKLGRSRVHHYGIVFWKAKTPTYTYDDSGYYELFYSKAGVMHSDTRSQRIDLVPWALDDNDPSRARGSIFIADNNWPMAKELMLSLARTLQSERFYVPNRSKLD